MYMSCVCITSFVPTSVDNRVHTRACAENRSLENRKREQGRVVLIKSFLSASARERKWKPLGSYTIKGAHLLDFRDGRPWRARRVLGRCSGLVESISPPSRFRYSVSLLLFIGAFSFDVGRISVVPEGKGDTSQDPAREIQLMKAIILNHAKKGGQRTRAPRRC